MITTSNNIPFAYIFLCTSFSYKLNSYLFLSFLSPHIVYFVKISKKIKIITSYLNNEYK